METKKRRKARKFDDQFRLSVLKEYYEGNQSLFPLCKKYEISISNFRAWEKRYQNKTVSLPEDILELEKEVFMARKSKESRTPKVLEKPKSREEEMQDEIRRLRKALEYSELRNEALNEVLKIGREQYGIDLLKKAGAKPTFSRDIRNFPRNVSADCLARAVKVITASVSKL